MSDLGHFGIMVGVERMVASLNLRANDDWASSKARDRMGWLSALLAIAVATVGSQATAQQNMPPSPVAEGLTPNTGAPFPKGGYTALDKLPDWGGIWFRTFAPPAPGTPPEQPKLKGEYQKKHLAWREEVATNNGVVKQTRSNCSPPGMPIFMQIPQYPFEFLFTPGRVVVNQEAWMQTRTIWTDGRKHPEDPDPTFTGHSIGRWEGETLVVDTIAINDELDIAMGMRHSPKLRVTERIALSPTDPDTLVDEIRLEDPDALAEPFTTKVTYKRDRYGRLLEFQCSQNDRNQVLENGLTQSH